MSSGWKPFLALGVAEVLLLCPHDILSFLCLNTDLTQNLHDCLLSCPRGRKGAEAFF